jgi:ketosteroid isomerase-like protein
MVSWLAHRLMNYNMRRLNAGDVEPVLRMDAEDVVFRFPGDTSWSGEFHGKRELRPWLERFARVGLQIFADEVVVKGWPWRQTICVRGHDYLRDHSTGQLIYENRYVLWGRIEWGKLKDYEAYEDTRAATLLDEYLLPREQGAAVT